MIQQDFLGYKLLRKFLGEGGKSQWVSLRLLYIRCCRWWKPFATLSNNKKLLCASLSVVWLILEKEWFDSDCFLFPVDFESLYTNIPVKYAIEFILWKQFFWIELRQQDFLGYKFFTTAMRQQAFFGNKFCITAMRQQDFLGYNF